MSNPLTPSDLAVYRQPGRDAVKWQRRGVTVAFGWEAERSPAGVPSVPINAWDAMWNTAGVKRIREPDVLSLDNADAGLLALLYGQDEPDNLVVERQDTNPAAEESVYTDAAAWCRQMKTGAPNKPTIVNLGLEQIQWTRPGGKPKVDYARLCQPFDFVSVDWYPAHRSRPVADYGTLIDKLAALIGMGKIIVGFCECSFQNLDPAAYPNQRAPTAPEFTDELRLLARRGIAPGLFPQRLPGRGMDFNYDAMPDELVTALAAWRGAVPVFPPVTPAPQPQPVPAPAASLESRVAKLEADVALHAGLIATLQKVAWPVPPAAPAQPNVRKPKKPN